MTGRTEPPDLKRHLRQLERRVEQLERANRTKRVTRPRPALANELLLGVTDHNQLHGFTEDGDGYIHFNAPDEWDNGYFYQTSSGTAGSTRRAEIVLATSTYGNFAPEIRMRGDSEDGTTEPAHVSIDTKNGKLDILGSGGAFVFSRNVPTVRGTTAGVSVASTQFFLQVGTTVLTPPNRTVTFPSAFPTNVVSVTACFGDSAGVSDFYVTATSTTGFQFQSSAAVAHRVNWIALGY